MAFASRSVLGLSSRILLGTTAIGSSAAMYQSQNDEGLRRSLYYWRNVVPIYLHYRGEQLYMETMGLSDEEQDARYEKLHKKYAPKLYNIILELKGFYMKIAQMGSTRPDFLPPIYIDRLSTLQDAAPAKEIGEIYDILEKSYGKKVEEVFSSIDEKALGVAAIGQCHRAKLASNGQEVAIKVKHPEAETFFRQDMATMKTFCGLFQPAYLPYLEEIERQFMTEFDFRREADNLATCRRNIGKSPYKDQVVIPQPYLNMCTKEVLVMEYLKGRKLLDGIQDHFEAIAAMQNVSVDFLKAQQEIKDKEREEKGLDIECGPSASDMKWYIRTFAIQKVFFHASQMLYDYTLGWIIPIDRETPSQFTHELLNIPEILQLIMDVHGYEIFVDGAFNADPHPGNIMLLEDGRLGLIDYGQVKYISKQDRQHLAKLILALADGTKEDIVRIMTQEMGIQSKYSNAYFLEKQARLMMDTDDRQVTEGKNVAMFIEYLDSIDQITHLPDQFVMAFRTSLLLRGFSYLLHYKYSHAQSWKEFAKQTLAEK